jgi:hypothetical protein
MDMFIESQPVWFIVAGEEAGGSQLRMMSPSWWWPVTSRGAGRPPPAAKAGAAMVKTAKLNAMAATKVLLQAIMLEPGWCLFQLTI